MPHQHENQRQQFHYFANRKLDEFYASVALRSFAMGMIGIFIPIFLLKIGYGLRSVLLFFVAYSIVHVLCTFGTATFVARWGCKHAMLASVPFYVGFYLLLYSIEAHHWDLWVVATVLGIGSALYWMGYHVDFVRFSDQAARGRELSVVHIISAIANVAGPLAGGIVAARVGFQPLFLLVIVLLVVSVVPLLFSADDHVPGGYALRHVFRNRSARHSLTLSALAIETSIDGVLWPIVMFSAVLHSFSSLGLVASASFTMSLLFTFLVGRWTDGHRAWVLRIGAVLSAVSWTVRSSVRTTPQVYGIQAFYGLSSTMVAVPYTASNYDEASQRGIIPYIVYREFMLHSARIVFYLVAAYVIVDLTASFGIGAIAALLQLIP